MVAPAKLESKNAGIQEYSHFTYELSIYRHCKERATLKWLGSSQRRLLSKMTIE